MGNASVREGGGGSVGVAGAEGGGGVGQHHHPHQQPPVGFHAAVSGGQQQQQQRGGPSGHGIRAHSQAQPMRDQPRFGHAPSTESMNQSPSGSPGSVARSPLTFNPQVRKYSSLALSFVWMILWGSIRRLRSVGDWFLICRSDGHF